MVDEVHAPQRFVFLQGQPAPQHAAWLSVAAECASEVLFGQAAGNAGPELAVYEPGDEGQMLRVREQRFDTDRARNGVNHGLKPNGRRAVVLPLPAGFFLNRGIDAMHIGFWRCEDLNSPGTHRYGQAFRATLNKAPELAIQ